MCGGSSVVLDLRCVRVAVFGSCNEWQLRWGDVAEHESCDVEKLQCRGVGLISMPFAQSLCQRHGHHAFVMVNAFGTVTMSLTWSPLQVVGCGSDF